MISILMQCKVRHIPVTLFSMSFCISWAKMNATLFTGLLMLAVIHLQVTFSPTTHDHYYGKLK